MSLSRTPSNRWTTLSYVYAACVVVGMAYFLLGVPVQVSDSFGNILEVTTGTLSNLVYRQFYQRSYLRPFLWGNLRVVYDLSGGHYFEWFRGWHVAQVVVLVVLFLRLIRPRTSADAAASVVGLAALVGIHTFAGTVREAFPINTFMTILICCFAAADLALGPARWWRDVAAVVLLVFAALTVESGLLIGVVFVAARLAGARGVSRLGTVGIVLLIGGYFYLRFALLNVGAPDLQERNSGFGFANRTPDELRRMFGGNPFPFYAYNVLSSLLSLFFAEPRAGVWNVTRSFVAGEPSVPGVIGVIASTLGTVLIAAEATAYDQPIPYNPCLECKLCVAACPVGAIAPDGQFNFSACYGCIPVVAPSPAA